jgi:hypothetical protein
MARQRRDRTGGTNGFDRLVELPNAGQVDQPMIQLLRRPERVAVPLDDFAELETQAFRK